ncbi:hypothetical protein ACKFKF_34935 [Phormidesmis sp. 146-12]
MPQKKYIVSLKAEERQFLEHFTTTGKASVAAVNLYSESRGIGSVFLLQAEFSHA